MSFLKKPLVAFLLCVLIVFSATVISVHLRLDPRCDTLRDRFSDSIGTQLSAYCGSCKGLIGIAKDYGLDCDAAEADVGLLVDALPEGSPSELCTAYRRLGTEMRALQVSLQNRELSEKDAAMLEALSNGLTGAQSAIESSSYNSEVSSFLRDKLGSFSTAFARLLGVRLPEQFR